MTWRLQAFAAFCERVWRVGILARGDVSHVAVPRDAGAGGSIEEQGARHMAEDHIVDLWDEEDEFDPLAVDDLDINQEDMDDDNPLDTVDYPTMRNMPEDMHRESVYSPERQGGAVEAVLSMLDHNPARRPVLVSILGWCEGGCLNSELTEKVDALQADNRSVYGTTTLCRMLERAGALELEMPKTSEEREDVEAGVEYLEIKERVDPTWRTTEAGCAVFAQMTDGSSFRAMVFDRDVKYLEVYRAVMNFVAESPRSKDDIEQLVDAFEVVQSPRRFGGHFIDMLERTDALHWKDRSWQLTDLGRQLLPEVNAAFSKKGE